MNIEKVKEALELALREHNDFMSQADLPIGSKKIEEALAELEKPAVENARIIAIDISLGALDRAEYWEVIVPQVIQQYAEAFHARRLTEAQAIIDAEPHGMIASGIAGPMSLNAQLKRCESYHAKKCAECIGNLPAFPHRPSRFPESRPGVTTDVDK